jgi:hypothetical protein
MLYFWLLDLCATCAREDRDFTPYHQIEDLILSVGTRMKSTSYALDLLAEGYGMKYSL